MTKVFSYTQEVEDDIIDAFCVLQEGFTDQFAYYDKAKKTRYLGMGRCVAIGSLHELEFETQGPIHEAPVFFTFNRFDAENPQPCDELFATFPRLKLMLPEVILIENDEGRFLQVNSLGPVYGGRVSRFAKRIEQAPRRSRVSIPYVLKEDDTKLWEEQVKLGLAAISEGKVEKVVLSRRRKLVAEQAFTSKDLLINLIDGPSRGVVIMYRYGDVFFCGCTPELLVRKKGNKVESMCLAGTTGCGSSTEEKQQLAEELLHDEKNLKEHAFVVDLIREVLLRNCYDVEISHTPEILSLEHVQHLHTPAKAKVMEGVSLNSLMKQLHPTPAVGGTPVGEALMLIRQIETYNRGFYAGACGYVNALGDGEVSVGLRTGVFDGEIGWVYAGCGIVAGSEAADEFGEIDMKLQTVLSAFKGEDTIDAPGKSQES